VDYTERFPKLDKRSCEQLVYRAKSLVGQYGFTGEDFEDIQQELYLHLYRQMPKYDPKRSSKATFVDRVLRNAACDLVRGQIAQMRHYTKGNTSLDQPISFDNEGDITLGDTISNDHALGTPHAANDMTKVDLSIDMRRLLAQIEPRMGQFCLDIASEKSATQIAKEHGICRQTFYIWKVRIRTLFESAGLQAYVGANT